MYRPGGMLLEDVVGTSGSNVYYFHSDRQGSVRALTSSKGASNFCYDRGSVLFPLVVIASM